MTVNYLNISSKILTFKNQLKLKTIMGKGDKKSKRGKINSGTFGVRRRKNKKPQYVAAAVVEVKEPKEEVKAKKKATPKAAAKATPKAKTKAAAKPKVAAKPKAAAKAKKADDKE
jgi:ribosomal small subunit protein bTHX